MSLESHLSSAVNINAAPASAHDAIPDGVRENVRKQVHFLSHDAGETSADECGEMRRNERLENGAVLVAPRTQPGDDDLDAASAAIRFEERLKPLSPRQAAAINLLAMGKTVIAVARTVKVSSSTIHRWKAIHPRFIAELNRRAAATFEGTVNKLRLTMDRAVDELMDTLQSPSRSARMEVAWRLLPMMKPQRLIVPTAPTSALDVVDAMVREARHRRGEVADGAITDEERLAVVPAEDRVEDRVVAGGQ